MKKKLLFINGHMNTGGVEKSLLDVLTYLDYDKYEVDLLLLETVGDYATQIPEQVNVRLCRLENTYGAFGNCLLRCIWKRDWFSLKMRLVFLSMRFMGNQQIARAKHMLTNGKEYDCVIGFRRGLCTQIAANAVNAKRRITWWHHGTVNVDPAVYLSETEKCDRIVAVSEGCRKMLLEEMPSLECRLATIYNILNPEKIRKQSSAFFPYLMTPNNVYHIVSVGGLVPEKHFENAIAAAKTLKDRGISFQWHLIGDGVLRRDLEEKAMRMGVMDCFVFEGNQVNPYPYMKHADLFVHPSYVESFGIVVAEALSLGIPCVVTKSTGVMDFLRDGKNAILTEQSPESLSDAVVKVLYDEELRNQLKREAKCPEQFLPSMVMKRINALMEADI